MMDKHWNKKQNRKWIRLESKVSSGSAGWWLDVYIQSVSSSCLCLRRLRSPVHHRSRPAGDWLGQVEGAGLCAPLMCSRTDMMWWSSSPLWELNEFQRSWTQKNLQGCALCFHCVYKSLTRWQMSSFQTLFVGRSKANILELYIFLFLSFKKHPAASVARTNVTALFSWKENEWGSVCSVPQLKFNMMLKIPSVLECYRKMQ